MIWWKNQVYIYINIYLNLESNKVSYVLLYTPIPIYEHLWFCGIISLNKVFMCFSVFLDTYNLIKKIKSLSQIMSNKIDNFTDFMAALLNCASQKISQGLETQIRPDIITMIPVMYTQQKKNISPKKGELLGTEQEGHAQQTRGVEPKLASGWTSVVDGGPTLNQYWVNVSWLLYCCWVVLLCIVADYWQNVYYIIIYIYSTYLERIVTYICLTNTRCWSNGRVMLVHRWRRF